MKSKKEQTQEKHLSVLLPLLEEKLIYARRSGTNVRRVVDTVNGYWGIVVPISIIESILNFNALYGMLVLIGEGTHVKGEFPNYKVDSKVWAIWEDSKAKAISSYQTATEKELRPQSLNGGRLTFVDHQEFEFILVDESFPDH
jgi:hypothetical protein